MRTEAGRVRMAAFVPGDVGAYVALRLDADRAPTAYVLPETRVVCGGAETDLAGLVRFLLLHPTRATLHRDPDRYDQVTLAEFQPTDGGET